MVGQATKKKRRKKKREKKSTDGQIRAVSLRTRGGSFSSRQHIARDATPADVQHKHDAVWCQFSPNSEAVYGVGREYVGAAGTN